VDTVLISACLTGKNCRYDGASKQNPEAVRLSEEQPCLLICPETMGGLVAPRPPAEIVGGTGADVLHGTARVIDKEGKDVTDAFLAGARAVLARARETGAAKVILKSKSPSCGLGRIYDGTFTGTLREGDGVTAALLKEEGIQVLLMD